MSERPTDQPTTDVSWAEGPSPHQVVEPTGKRTQGWYEGTGNDDADLHPAGYENWLDREHGRYLSHMAAVLVREFSDMADGIAAVAAPGRFVVHPPAGGNRPMGEVAFSVYGGAGPSTGANNYIFLPCTDGERIYYHEGEILLNKIYAANPSDGSTIWGPKTVGTSAQGLCCDGQRVYYTDYDDVLAVYSLDPLSGDAVGSSDTAGLNIIKLRCNGQYLAGVDNTNQRVHIHSNPHAGAGSITYDGYVQYPDLSLGSVGLDHVNGYMGGNRGTPGTYDLHQFKLSTRAIGWQVTLPTTSRHTIKGIVSDGVTVYVSADVQTLTAGGTASVYALNALNGNILWSADTIYNSHLDAIAIDDYWLYVGNENQNNTYVLDKRSGVIVAAMAGHVVYGADGVSTVGQGGSLSPNGDKLTRNWRGGPSREFQRVGGDDENRHPFYTGAVPMHERP
jgi:hypothetical protein